MLVGWPARADYQFIALRVPKQARDARDYTHLGIRLGQFEGATSPYANAAGEPQDVFVAVYDGSASHGTWLDGEDAVPHNDPRSSGLAHSAMRTYSLWTGGFHGVNRANIERIYLIFPPNTSGTLIVDSVEWWDD